MKLWTMLALFISTSAWSQEVLKVFSDKGSSFVRTDKRVLTVGLELETVTDAAGSAVIGSAVVMEVTGPLARISLDDDSTKAKVKFVRLGEVKAAAAAVAPTPPPAAAAAPSAPGLKGKLENGLRVAITNDSDSNWTGCELRFNDGRFYALGSVEAHSDDKVIAMKFSRPPEPLYDHVVVACDEGETKFMFDNPRSPGGLKGYVENLGSGRIIVHNSSDKTWSRCDVRKPNREHYIMESLKAGDQESIRSGNFKKEPEPAATQLMLTCKQGELKLDLK